MQKINEENVTLLIVIFLTGIIVIPIFFLGNGLFYISQSLNRLSDQKSIWNAVIFATLLLSGSILGCLFCEILFNRVVALILTLLINGVVAVLTVVAIMSMPKFVWLCAHIFGLTTGMIGPILVSFITDQYDLSITCGPFLCYSIICCYLLASMFLLYIPKWLFHSSILVIISIICIVIALVAIIIVSTRFKKYIMIKKRDNCDKPTKAQMLGLLQFLVPALLLLVIINILLNGFWNWAKENFSCNAGHYTMDEPVLFQFGFAGIFLIPIVIVFGIKFHPKLYITLAFLLTLIAACLWPFIAKSCIMIPDITYFGRELMTATIFNTRDNILFLDKPVALFRFFKLAEYHFYRETNYRNETDAPFFTQLTGEKYNFNRPCKYDVNFIVMGDSFRENQSAYQGMTYHCIQHKRHISGLPTVGILTGLREQNRTVTLFHIETETEIVIRQIDYPNPIHVLQLLPGNWSIFQSGFHESVIGNSTYVVTFKRGGFYYIILEMHTWENKVRFHTSTPVPILKPYVCDANTNLFNFMYWLLTLGKILIVTSTLLICVSSLEINLKCLPLVGCFICFHLSFIISHTIAVYWIIPNYVLLAALFVVFLLYFPYLTGMENETNEENESRRPERSEQQAEPQDYAPKPIRPVNESKYDKRHHKQH